MRRSRADWFSSPVRRSQVEIFQMSRRTTFQLSGKGLDASRWRSIPHGHGGERQQREQYKSETLLYCR